MRRRSAVLGMIAGLALLELLLRLWSTPYDTVIGSVPIEHDSTDGWTGTVRYYHEGVATAHFSAANARLTGHAWLPDAPVILLIGDSYVQALQVADNETTGGVLENLSRAAGIRLNVRQYGTSGAGPAYYLTIAKAVRTRWNPAQVVIVLNHDDFVAPSPDDEPSWSIGPDSSLRVTVHPAAPTAKRGWLGRTAGQLLRHSVLVTEIRRRILVLQTPTAAPRTMPDSPLMPDAVVRSLGQEFGDRLLLVYASELPVTGASPDTTRTRFFAACAAHQAHCVDPADSMAMILSTRGIAARGFGNSMAGEGHLNKTGHAIMAGIIWNSIRQSPALTRLSNNPGH